MGMLQGAPTQFENCRDVSFGGVLCALPALVANGLFEHLEKTFPSLSGYYTTLQVVTLLAYMALCRIKTVDQLQYAAPGELGKLKEMWRTHRIACITYHKHPKEAWPEEEFSNSQVTLPRGESVVSMKLAERGSWIGDKKNGLWVREVRKLTSSGHQVSLISSVYGQSGSEDAARLFSRWSQENFFRYMMQHYAIDLLSEYRTEEIPGTTRPVVNPRWRELDGRIRSLTGKLQRRRAEFGAHAIHPESDEEAMPKWEHRKSELAEAVEQTEHELEELKRARKAVPHHLEWGECPAEDKFERLAPSRKRLTDTVKLIAYRAETALSNIVREALARPDDARSLLCDLFRSEADLSVDKQSGTLTIGVHPMATPRSNRAIEHLLAELNATEMQYPGTSLKLVYTLVGVSAN